MAQPVKSKLLVLILILLSGALGACGEAPGAPVLKVGGIPDQDASRLARRYQVFADYLSRELGVPVQYVPSVDYAAVVTAFTQGDLQLAFFGGLTGVQARLQTPGARAIAQREHDARFHSKFIVRSGLVMDSLEDLKAQASGLTMTFGSESSTSGHLMPRHFLAEAGIDADRDFRSLPNFSGSHDLTWQLIESGSFDVGALNEDVWNRAVRVGRADTEKVREFYTTPDYFDYNWTARPELDQVYGPGFTGEIQRALLKLNPRDHGDILDLFSTQRFIESDSSNYRAIEQAARNLGMVK
ncbi:MAG: putative selenate ABC transporter substrate-binding protein [Chloroflexi bacterium]|nr:putative selenate ABC transporter substrate-binding protein [Chloroflexota bacterium]MCI0787114.1 putative selenate ABC transporter substrate-binding protein [Chloroflexota bacterium]MCI0868029.1 putative selenate ABC transporter substrate-binding protein [Chloroflexota bacterium]MCI0879871.1 putative selenate ABC transporter substrate-binding protein [Chloroflexota bacterium]